MTHPVAHDPNLNALWCRCIAEEIARAGVRFVVLCPGSRNSPLVFALAEQPSLTCISHVDERSAGFIAIGMARQSDERVAICVTSGSALSNLAPAISEAHAAGIPLIVISADRPWEAHHCGAPQTMPQRGIYAAFMRDELALGEPTADIAALRSLRARVSRLAQTDAGPVHLNVPLRDPLPPLPDAKWNKPTLPIEVDVGRGVALPFTAVQRPSRADTLQPWPYLRPGLRGVIVAGAQGGRYQPPELIALAQSTGWPVLADAASGLRIPDLPSLITTADALLTGSLSDAQPELIIQYGPAPLARPVYEWLAKQDCPWICLETSTDQDWLSRAWITVQGHAGPTLAHLATCCAPGNSAWNERWQRAEMAARTRLAATWPDEPFHELVATHCAVNHAGFSFVHLASSMAIRHANLLMAPSPRPVFANRGVNGIDGTLGTFMGECLASNQSGLLVIGDLAFLHDLPALAAHREPVASGTFRPIRPRGAIVLLNNDGGAIFDYLPVAQVPDYERWIRTPHGLEFSYVAEQFGLPYRRVETAADLVAALDEAANGWTVTLIECRVSGDIVARHRRLLSVLAAEAPILVQPG